jgi:hypothetical protein
MGERTAMILERLKDAIVYKRIAQPFSLAEALAYLQVNHINKEDGSPIKAPDIKHSLGQAVASNHLVNVHDMYWFPEIPVSDKDYLRGLLHGLIQKLRFSS